MAKNKDVKVPWPKMEFVLDVGVLRFSEEDIPSAEFILSEFCRILRGKIVSRELVIKIQPQGKGE